MLAAPLWAALLVAVPSVMASLNTVAHPYLLADNRCGCAGPPYALLF